MRNKRTVLATLVVGLSVLAPVSPWSAVAQDATPTMTYSCEDVAGTPGAMMGGMTGMATGTPMAGMNQMTMELDQMYIDMMIPHHAGIIGLSQAALPRLQDERLQEIARNIIDVQSAEIEELRGYREQFYGDPQPMPMDQAMMETMAQMVPGMSGTMEEMAVQMDPAAQAAAICAAEETDLTFIEMTIAHHQMAIASSEPVVAGAANDEIRQFAQRVIDDQQREIEELEAIQADLTGAATPTS